MDRYWEWPFAIMLTSLLIAIVYRVAPGNTFDFTVTLLFLSICPGVVVVRWVRMKSLLLQLMAGIAVSYAIDGMVMGGLMYAGQWNPELAIVILIFFCDLNAIIQFFALRPTKAAFA